MEVDDSLFTNESAERFCDITKAWLADSERSADSVVSMTADQKLSNVPEDTILNGDHASHVIQSYLNL